MKSSLRYTLLASIAVLLLSAVMIGGTGMAESVHAHRSENIGDVHPYWDEASQTWYMYYLRTDGSFSAALMCSSDMLTWTPAPLESQGTLAAYYVLGVQKASETYYSWYGSDLSMTASASEDLRHWRTPGGDFNIPMGYTSFISMRDPYVFFDEDNGVWRVICVAYRTNQLRGRGLGMKCALATAASAGEIPKQWSAVDTALLEFPDGLNGEPECPQMMKIGNRWYIFASMARRHENHVGRLSYYIGEEGKGILEQDWSRKEEHFLTSEDLCAAQVAQGPEGIFLWGWIAPNWDGGGWGGDLSLPLQISQNPDGTLSADLVPQVGQNIRGELLACGTDVVTGSFQRWDAEVDLTLDRGERAVIQCANGQIVLDDGVGSFSVGQSDLLIHVSFAMSPGALAGQHTLRIIAEDNILEVFLDGQWALAARMQLDVCCTGVAVHGGSDTSIRVYTLR